MTTIRLSKTTDSRLDLFTQLTNHQLRSSLELERGMLVAESEIAIRTALACGVQPIAFLLDERKLQAMGDVLGQVPDEVPVFVLPPEEAERLTGYRVTRGALCAMQRPSLPSMDELVRAARRMVVVEGVTDTSNVGAIFRNAAALGADAVVVAPNCADPLARRAVRVSMGNVFRVPWCRAEGRWPHGLVDELRANGFCCLSLALTSDALNLDDARLRGLDRTALFFGTEGTGLSRAVLNACDHAVVIPMSHGVDSLNVAASSAVALWELFCRAR